MKIKKGDKVQIIAGKDRVKKDKKGEKTAKANQGKVIHVYPEKEKVSVENLNLRTKHMKPKRGGEKGQVIQYPAPIAVSKVMLVCPKCDEPTRVGYRLLQSDLKGKKKVRLCKKCGQAID